MPDGTNREDWLWDVAFVSEESVRDRRADDEDEDEDDEGRSPTHHDDDHHHHKWQTYTLPPCFVPLEDAAPNNNHETCRTTLSSLTTCSTKEKEEETRRCLHLAALPLSDGVWSPLGAQAWYGSALMVAWLYALPLSTTTTTTATATAPPPRNENNDNGDNNKVLNQAQTDNRSAQSGAGAIEMDAASWLVSHLLQRIVTPLPVAGTGTVSPFKDDAVVLELGSGALGLVGLALAVRLVHHCCAPPPPVLTGSGDLESTAGIRGTRVDSVSTTTKNKPARTTTTTTNTPPPHGPCIHVVLTDSDPDVLRQLQINVNRNVPFVPSSTTSRGNGTSRNATNLQQQQEEEEEQEQPHNQPYSNQGVHVSVARLDWNEVSSWRTPSSHNNNNDQKTSLVPDWWQTTSTTTRLVVGSELIYSLETAMACATCVRTLLSQSTIESPVVALVVQCTSRPGWSEFVNQLRQSTAVSTNDDNDDDDTAHHPPNDSTMTTTTTTRTSRPWLQVVEQPLTDWECHGVAQTMVPWGGSLDPRFEHGLCLVTTRETHEQFAKKRQQQEEEQAQQETEP